MGLGFWKYLETMCEKDLSLMSGTNPVYIPRRSDVIRRKRLALRVARSKGRGRR